jgi:hypothetical protein
MDIASSYPLTLLASGSTIVTVADSAGIQASPASNVIDAELYAMWTVVDEPP